jgi:hypothetical protein
VYYPEQPEGPITEAWHAKKWHEDIPLDQLTATYAQGGKIYYVNELCRLHDGRYVIPQRWITRKGVLTADCAVAVWDDSNPYDEDVS